MTLLNMDRELEAVQPPLSNNNGNASWKPGVRELFCVAELPSESPARLSSRLTEGKRGE